MAAGKALVDKDSGGLGETSRERGSVAAAFEEHSTVVEAIYKTPFLAHVSIEPPMATVHIHNGICEIWACTQTPQTTQRGDDIRHDYFHSCSAQHYKGALDKSGSAITNAVFAATKKRIRELQLCKHFQV